jgi:transcriptional regulator with XRE-family HTH domain
MSSERAQEVLSFEALGTHRHLVVSERLRLRRRELGLTQKEVVARLRRLGVGTTNKALSSLEHGAGLDVCKLPELARALDCTLTYLVGLTSRPDSWEPDGARWSDSGRDGPETGLRQVGPMSPVSAAQPARGVDGTKADVTAATAFARPGRHILAPMEPHSRVRRGG